MQQLSRRCHDDINENMWGFRPYPTPKYINLHHTEGPAALGPPAPAIQSSNPPSNPHKHYNCHGNGRLLATQRYFAGNISSVHPLTYRTNYNTSIRGITHMIKNRTVKFYVRVCWYQLNAKIISSSNHYTIIQFCTNVYLIQCCTGSCSKFIVHWNSTERIAFNESFTYYQATLIHVVECKYRPTENNIWTLLNAIFFTATVVTTIGI